MQHPFRIVVSFLVLALLGLIVLPRLSVHLNPDRTLPALTLAFSLPGADPETVEQQATSVLENAFSVLAGLNEIRSVSGYEQGTVTLLFDRHTDMQQKRFEVISLLRNTRRQWPEGMSYPDIRQNREKEGPAPLLVYRVNAPFATAYIRSRLEQEVLRAVAAVPGVDQVQVAGAVPMQVVVAPDRHKLRAWNLSFGQLQEALQEATDTRHLGLLRTGTGYSYYLKNGSPRQQPADLRRLVVAYRNGQPVRLGDVARVYTDEQPPYRYFRVNGLNSITLRIYARQQQNRIALARQLRQVVKAAARQLPPGFEVLLDFDDTVFLVRELNKIYFRSGLSILILTLFIFVSYRNFRHLFILLSGIIVTLCLTVLAAWLMQIQVHLYTIAGITIAFGLIVDNAIVMLDHLRQHGNRKLLPALLGATLTTVAALALIWFLPEEERQNLTEFAAIISLSLAISLVVALWFTPALCRLVSATGTRPAARYRTLRRQARWWSAYQKATGFLLRHRYKLMLLLVLLFGTPVFLLPARWEGQEWYNSTIGSDWYQEEVRPHTDKWLGGTLRLFVRNVFEKSGYRTNEQTRLYVQASLPYGHTLEQMNRAVQYVEEYLKGVAGIDKFVTSVYSGQYASIVITFSEAYEKGSLPYQLKARLIARSLDWGGVDWSVYGVGRGFSNMSSDGLPSFRVLMKGYNYDELERLAGKLAGLLLRHKRIQKVNTNERLSWDEKASTRVVLEFDLSRLPARAPLSRVAATLRQQAHEQPATTYLNLHNQLVPVVVRYPDARDFSTYRLRSGTLHLNDTTRLAYAGFTSLYKEKTVNAIHKQDRQYIRVVGFDYYGSARFGSRYLDQVLEEMKGELPLGYTAERSGWSWNWQKVKRNYGLLLILAVAVYFICSILFENLRQPLAILGMIPLSFIGLFITFAGFDFYFDQGGYAAFVLLGGITVNAAIFIVFDLHQRSRGSFNRRVLKAVWVKARPVLLTVASTCFGLVPFLLEGQNEVFWFSLAAGTIGGLIFSLLAVFWVLPVWLMKKS